MSGSVRKILRILATSVVLATVAVLVILFVQYKLPTLLIETVKTKNQSRTFFMEQLANDLDSYSITDQSLQAKFKQRCRKLDADPESIAMIRIGDRFCEIVDEHGESWMKLLDINSGRLHISYFKSFNHSAFGKPLIEIDEGAFQWP